MAANRRGCTYYSCNQLVLLTKQSPVVITNADEAWEGGEQGNEEVSGSMSSKDSNEGRPITSVGV